jgi:hypothetical protein
MIPATTVSSAMTIVTATDSRVHDVTLIHTRHVWPTESAAPKRAL